MTTTAAIPNEGNFTVVLVRGSGNPISLSPEDIIEINIVEDVYALCMYGDITFIDKIGWTEKLEAVGQDVVAIIYNNENKLKVEKLFVVYNYEAMVEESQKDMSLKKIKWYLVEPLFIALTVKKYSKAWGEGVLGSDIIKSICKDILGISTFKTFESTKETFDNFYIPQWTAAEAIKWLMKRCSGSQSGLPGYLFYSNSQGLNLTTIESLMTSSTRERDGKGNVKKYSFSGQNSNESRVFSWYTEPPDLTSIDKLSGGTRCGYQFNGKKIIEHRCTYKTSLDRYSTMGNTTLFSDISDPTTNITFECETDETALNNMHDGDFINRYTRQLKAGLVVKGESTRYAGMIIDVAWKSSDDKKITDKMMEGLWMVKSITHQFTNGIVTSPPYRQLLVCVKTGYENTQGKQLMPNNENRIGDTYTI